MATYDTDAKCRKTMCLNMSKMCSPVSHDQKVDVVNLRASKQCCSLLLQTDSNRWNRCQAHKDKVLHTLM